MPALGACTRRTWRSHNERGFQLYELLVVLTILSMVATVGIPRLLDWTRRLKIELATHELVGVLRMARSYAVRHSTKVGVKFRPDGATGTTFTLYRDGDGDGVLTADIESGVDPAIDPARQLAHFGSFARFGFPPGPPPRDPGDPSTRLDRLDDPIRFNRSDIASFNHLGGSTPGSLYVTDGRYLLAVVRLYGRTGKIRILHYDPETEMWRR